MPRYTVTITETVLYSVEVEAEDEDEAIGTAEERFLDMSAKERDEAFMEVTDRSADHALQVAA